MMDFEAWWNKQNGIALQMAPPKTIAKAAWEAGRESMKDECIEVVNRQALDDFVLQTIMGKIKKL